MRERFHDLWEDLHAALSELGSSERMWFYVTTVIGIVVMLSALLLAIYWAFLATPLPPDPELPQTLREMHPWL